MNNNKFSTSKIYKITSNIEPFYYYIGSTTSSINRRLSQHKAVSKLKPNDKKYKYFLSINWNVSISLIKEVDVSDMKELRKIEDEYIQLFLNDLLCLNTYSAVINKEKRKICLRENNKRYYSQHTQEMRNKHNNYYLMNKETKQLKYEQHKDEINEKRRTRFTCLCGKTISKGYKAEHERSLYHKEHIKS